jgi:hypothetical protein
MSCDDS